jgi:hypothetical protein
MEATILMALWKIEWANSMGLTMVMYRETQILLWKTKTLKMTKKALKVVLDQVVVRIQMLGLLDSQKDLLVLQKRRWWAVVTLLKAIGTRWSKK